MNNNYTYSQETSDNPIHQLYDDTCAIKSQQLILQSHGIDLSEQELCEEAVNNNWYFPGDGTPMGDVGNLLEYHGMDVHKYIKTTLNELANELLQGHQVIAGVDSGELWNAGFSEQFEDLILGPQADHALIVSGFIVNPLTGNEEVLLTDPGTGELYAEYPVEQFEDAWADSDNFMVVTN